MTDHSTHHNGDHTPWTRRSFVRTAAAAAILPAVGAAAARQPASSRPPQPAPATDGKPFTGPIRIGLIGCGGRGTGACVQALRADKDAVLVSMGDTFADRLSSSLGGITQEMGDQASARVQVPKERQFVGLDCYHGVINSGVDMVLLTSYPTFRPEHLKAAIAAGKHVFAEKPVAVDAPGIRSVLASAAEARKKGLAIQVGFCWRYNDGMRATFEEVNSGGVGDVDAVYTTYLTGPLGKNPRKPDWSDLEFQMRNWWHFTWISGDHIVEQAIHSVDRLSWAMGDKLPARVICLGGRAARTGPESGNVYDHFSAVYEYDDGRRGFHACRQIEHCPGDNTDYIYGTKGMCTVNGWTPTYQIKDRAGKETWKYTGPSDRDMYQNEHDDLFRSIRAGKPINDCERGAHSTLMAIMGRMAAYTGQTITWDQALNSKEVLLPEKLAWGDMPTPAIAIPGQTKFT